MSGREDVRDYSRRQVLGLISAVAAAPFLGPVPLGRAAAAELTGLHFRALHAGKPVGEHSVAFRRDGNLLTVTTHIDILIKVLFFTAFRFKHDAEEIWQSGRLLSVESTTDDEGTLLQVSGRATSDGFRIQGPDGPFLASGELLTSNSVWNRRLMDESRLIDVQHGSEIGIITEMLGMERVDTPQGWVSASRYHVITPSQAGSLFFDGNGRWVKALLERHGEILEYALAS